jgi:superfamily II DNA or RNA helicase
VLPLNDYSFLSILDTSSNDLIQDFFIPALQRSDKYERGVGYFSSSWLRITSLGMVQFAKNGGKARWVTSPILDERDWEALVTGDQARNDILLYSVLKQNINDLKASLEQETLSALAWMVADGVLDFKLALPRNKLERGDFHDKFGVFSDTEGNQISFNGSYNDSVHGTRNYESIKVFCSWDSAFAPFVKADAARFESLWNNLDANVKVYDLPSASRDEIVDLRQHERPYPAPHWVTPHNTPGKPTTPKIPFDVTIRDYQEEAIQSWFSSGCVGLFEMATGTGKTITSLAASIKIYEQQNRIALVVACPYQHLVDQWVDEARRFGYSPIHAYKSKTSWLDEVHEKIISFNNNDIDNICIITTHATFSTTHFRDTLNRINGPALLIADEAHHLNSERQKAFFPETIQYRLALSATPDRWFSDDSTNPLRDYFGETVYSLPLQKAIEGGFLTPYYYYPSLVELTDSEMVEYSDLTTKIGVLMSHTRNPSNEDYLQHLLIKRSQLLNTAVNKLDAISELVDKNPNITHALFYCAPGQIDEVVELLGWKKRMRVHRFTAEEDTVTRQNLLDDFISEKLQALVAMRCLDEGVDVPSTRTAYILASSSNPREFIQRRGRILRKFPGKSEAVIYDLIAIPPAKSEFDEISEKSEKSLLRRELKRFAEFANTALNTQSAYKVIWGLAQEYGIYDFGGSS